MIRRPASRIRQDGRASRRVPRELFGLLPFLAACLFVVPGLVAQTVSVTGEVVDEESGEPVVDAEVRVEGEGTGLEAVTDERGAFHFPGVSPGSYRIHLSHLAYGERSSSLRIEAGSAVSVDIAMAQTPVELEGMTVEVMSEGTRRERARGSRANVVTREEIRDAARTSNHLGDILRQEVSGLQVRDTPLLQGARVCLEFRGRRSLTGSGCDFPVVYLDGVRVWDPASLLTTLSLDALTRIEVVPPSQAGLTYGGDADSGVILVETEAWADQRRREAVPAHLRPVETYDWRVESRPHPTLRVFAASALTNAAALGLTYLLASPCVEFQGVTFERLNTTCGGLATAGVRVAGIVLPSAAAAVGARWAGTTEFSRGRFLPAAIAAGAATVPGYIWIMNRTVDESAGNWHETQWVGAGLLTLGAPALATIADRLLRNLTADDGSGR